MGNTGKTGAAGTTEGTPAADATATATTASGTAASTDAGTTGEAGTTSETGKTGKTGETPTGTATGTQGKADTPAAESKAPEKYELTIPEETKAYADPAALKRIEEVARAAKWSNDDAQAALEEHLTLVKQQADTWAAETKADTEYGGDKFDETQRLARKVIDRVRPTGHARRDSFLTFLGRAGAGNHIEVVSFLADLGRQMGDDAPQHGRSRTGGSEDGASKLYDHPTSRKLEEDTRT